MNQSRWRYATLVSVILVCAALVVTTLRLRSSERALDATQVALAAQREAVKANQDAVKELCRTNGIMRGILIEVIESRKDLLRQGGIPKTARARYRVGISIYEGYLDQLDQQTACREVVRP